MDEDKIMFLVARTFFILFNCLFEDFGQNAELCLLQFYSSQTIMTMFLWASSAFWKNDKQMRSMISLLHFI